MFWEVKTGVFAFIGFAVFSYAIFTSLAAAIAILELAGWFDKWANANKSRIVKTGNRKRKEWRFRVTSIFKSLLFVALFRPPFFTYNS